MSPYNFSATIKFPATKHSY